MTAHGDGIAVNQLVDTIAAGDIAQVRAILSIRPELARLSTNNFQVLHHAVLHRSPEIVQLLMDLGANAHEGVYPHRDATSPLAIAAARGYDEIVAIIQAAEQRQRETTTGIAGVPPPDELFHAIASGQPEKAIALMESQPSLIQTCHPVHRWTPLHLAAMKLNTAMAAWLLDHGANVAARGRNGLTPLDLAAHSSSHATAAQFSAIASLLLAHGAEITAPAAVALGDSAWLSARHAAASLTNSIEDTGGLLRIAASHNRTEILSLLLDFGFDPNERTRCGEPGGDEIAFTAGMPLWHCAASGKHDIAELLLRHGADPNAAVYASGTPLYQAYGRRDWKMVELLQRHGGRPNGTLAGLYRQTELAKDLLAGRADTAMPDGMFEGKPLAEELLWAAACGGDPEIVRLALEHINWPRDDPRWFEILEQPLRFWNHGSGHWAAPHWDRSTYLDCFRLVLQRANPNLRGRVQDHAQSGLTILHSVCASRDHLTADDRVAFATALLDAGARLDLRDNLLQSTPLGWACRWCRTELVRLFLERGAAPVEPAAEPWATPEAWARRMGHHHLLPLLGAI
ncbi:MAG: ankyrin repeat domain-containing protein [Bryobacterales bacterium]|nr:ankyrin repeat domain-containing protein [Bryobacterales bacterium]